MPDDTWTYSTTYPQSIALARAFIACGGDPAAFTADMTVAGDPYAVTVGRLTVVVNDLLSLIDEAGLPARLARGRHTLTARGESALATANG